MDVNQKIPKISLEDLNKLVKGKRIFKFRPHLMLPKSYIGCIIGEKFHSISNALTTECFILICPERESYLKKAGDAVISHGAISTINCINYILCL